MKNSVENIMASYALRAVLNEDPDRFLRRAAVSLHNSSLEAFFYGQILTFADIRELSDADIEALWQRAQIRCLCQSERSRAVRLGLPEIYLSEGGLRITARFPYNLGDDTRQQWACLEIHQDDPLIDMFRIQTD